MATFSRMNIALTATATPVFQTLKKVETSLFAFSKRISGVTAGLATLTGGLGAFAGIAGVGAVVRSADGFNKAMANSLAIMKDVSDTMRNDMVQAAQKVAETTRFSATDAAESYFFLASAGLNAAQSIAALPQVAKFAQAGNFDMALATDLATDAQSALGLTVTDTAKNLENLTRVTDVLIKANTLANASAEQFSTALTKKAATAAKTLGKDIEEVVALLAAFADRGIKGADAGTAVNIVFRDLSTKALENAKAFERFNVRVFDSAGEFRNIADVIMDLENALKGMSDETSKATLKQLGFADKSVVFIQSVLGASEQIRGYETELRRAGGTTSDVASKQIPAATKAFNQLTARLTKFAGAAFDLVDGPLGLLLNSLTGLFDIINPVVSGLAAIGNAIESEIRIRLDAAASRIDQFKATLADLGATAPSVFVDTSTDIEQQADSFRRAGQFLEAIKQRARIPELQALEASFANIRTLGEQLIQGTVSVEQFRNAVDTLNNEQLVRLANRLVSGQMNVREFADEVTSMIKAIATQVALPDEFRLVDTVELLRQLQDGEITAAQFRDRMIEMADGIAKAKDEAQKLKNELASQQRQRQLGNLFGGGEFVPQTAAERIFPDQEQLRRAMAEAARIGEQFRPPKEAFEEQKRFIEQLRRAQLISEQAASQAIAAARENILGDQTDTDAQDHIRQLQSAADRIREAAKSPLDRLKEEGEELVRVFQSGRLGGTIAEQEAIARRRFEQLREQVVGKAKTKTPELFDLATIDQKLQKAALTEEDKIPKQQLEELEKIRMELKNRGVVFVG